MNQTIAPLLDCDFLLNTMPREKKKRKYSEKLVVCIASDRHDNQLSSQNGITFVAQTAV